MTPRKVEKLREGKMPVNIVMGHDGTPIHRWNSHGKGGGGREPGKEWRKAIWGNLEVRNEKRCAHPALLQKGSWKNGRLFPHRWPVTIGL